MLPQEVDSPPTARRARIVFFVSIVALGILSLLMIEAWGLDPSVSCPGAFPPATSCSARPLWFGLAVIWAAGAAGLVALWIIQAARRPIDYGMRIPPLATLVISIFLLGLGAFALWAGNEVSYSRFPSTLRDALVFAYVTAVLITLPATFLGERMGRNAVERGGRGIAVANGLFGFAWGFSFAYFTLVGCNCVTSSAQHWRELYYRLELWTVRRTSEARGPLLYRSRA